MKKVGITLGILVLIVAILGVIAPKDFEVEREIIINKPKQTVFNELKMVKNHESWSPWAKLDPNVKKEYRGVDGTVGFVFAWAGNKNIGVGEQEIKNLVDGERIDFELRFKEPMVATNEAYLVTEAVGDNQTKVKWGMKGHNSFPANIFCFVFNMKAELAKSFDEGLASFRSQLEK